MCMMHTVRFHTIGPWAFIFAPHLTAVQKGAWDGYEKCSTVTQQHTTTKDDLTADLQEVPTLEERTIRHVSSRENPRACNSCMYLPKQGPGLATHKSCPHGSHMRESQALHAECTAAAAPVPQVHRLVLAACRLYGIIRNAHAGGL